ncbi:adenosyl cobinamide kinase/adenosyl cobinamide phosphate guanylyltransferase [Sphaerochaeta pleomorpha str. Grapes]|uniref:Adenosylcobinamide kinase n=1 Tax=Sphaerochaeta pleomorpha (strain ATCC BAA-1885 / DSM 22778 / Grapes) TaxID=158190 RepID=G8QSJ7_SPHPG|nr:bifunctional adenosylcobinamide kinase/adenosylcobinamide-phosphate guanylyltransferase [Sphaerochaeta pleomorpha]AEV28958.1 adenosyl cobinamide kinase/adenosyl cobinamide phosphate guanylyltransferase [Sphaerochaeta pleomorpha str. Grapes]
MPTIDFKDMQERGKQKRKGPASVVSTTGNIWIRTKLKKQVSLVIGGGRSGKSSFAQDYALNVCDGTSSRAFIATAEAIDEEMQARIAAHQADRGDRFITVEEPLEIARAIASLPPSVEVVVVDCLTVWMGNLMYHKGIVEGRYPQMDELLTLLKKPPFDIVLVTNETGLGIIPADAESRRFRDLAGWMNQDIAAIAKNVILMVAGIPLAIKGVVI